MSSPGNSGGSHNCGSPGCSRRRLPSTSAGTSRCSPGCSGHVEDYGKHCSSPGCSGGANSRYTQAETRPEDPKPMPGTKERPKRGANFSTVLYDVTYGGWTVALIKYADVQKYGGLKLALYDDKVWEKLDKGSLDPHFYPDDAGPAARFEPNAAGVIMAMRSTGFFADNGAAKLSLEQDFKIFCRLINYNQGKK